MAMTRIGDYCLIIIIGLVTLTSCSGLHLQQFALATTEEQSDNGNNDDAIEEEMNKRQDQTKEIAEEALLNGTCLAPLDKMKILAHPDTEVAILSTEIPTC